MSPDRPTARAILIHGRDILLMRRQRGAEQYHVLPGGGLELGEAPLEACRREIREETGLDVADLRLVEIDASFAGAMHLYRAEVAESQVRLGGPEAGRSNPTNHYELVWVAIDDLAGVVLRPDGLIPLVIRAAETRPS